METNNDFEELNRVLGFEFNKYILARPDMLKKIPTGAQIIFQIDNNHDFNSWNKAVNDRQREPGQTFVVVRIEKLLPASTRLKNLHIEGA